MLDKNIKWFRTHYFYLLAFVIPLFILLLCYRAIGIYPFGEKSVLITDMWQQYIDFHAGYYDILTEGKSLLYTWNTGLGMNFVGIFAFYLASPFTFIIFLFQKAALPDAIMVIILLKIATGGFTFSFFAKKSRLIGISGLPNVALSVCYALCSYATAYTVNLMWLDGVMMLPILLLCTERLIEQKRWKPFLVCLCYIFFVNFYISFMMGGFCFLYFLAICVGGKFPLKVKEFVSRLLVFIGVAVLAAGICAILLIPSYRVLTDSYLKLDSPALGGGLENTFSQVLCKLFPGVYDTITYGTPNVYFGLLPLLLTSVYFVNKSVHIRERVAMFVLILFLYFSMMIRSFYLVWHVFQTPTWFPARFSFVFCMLCVFLAARGFANIKSVKYNMLPIPLALGVIMIFITQKAKGNLTYITDKALGISLGLLVTYAVLISLYKWLDRPFDRRIIASIMIVLVCLETYYSTYTYINGMNKELSYEKRSGYTDFYKDTSEVIDKIQSNDTNEFYRIENLIKRNSNDGLSLDYKGVAHYSSFSNQATNKFLHDMGLYATVNYRFFKYFVSSPVTDSMLGVKYVISDKDENSDYNQLYLINGQYVYENPYVFPLMYAASDNLSGFAANHSARIDSQNRFMEAAFGFGECYKELSCINKLQTNINYDGGYSWAAPSSGGGALQYTYTASISGNVYVDFYASNNNNIEVFVNDRSAIYPEVGEYITDIGYFNKGETIKLTLNIGKGGIHLQEPRAYVLDTSVMDDIAKAAQQNGVMLSDVKDTKIEGTITTSGDQLIMTSIPIEKGFSIYVDGKKTDAVIISDAFLAFNVYGSGQHKIVLKYMPRGFVMGVIISIFSLCVLASILIVSRRKKRVKIANG